MNGSEHLDLKYGSDRHKLFLDAVRNRVQKSDEKYRAVVSRYNAMEERFDAYVHESEIDKRRKAKQDTTGLPDYVQVNIPYTYAMIMTAHTYLASVLLSRDPIFRFAGAHGETEQQTQSLEAIVNYQMIRGAALVPLYLWLFDALKYNVGSLGHFYDEQYSNVTRIVEQQRTFGNIKLGSPKKVKQTARIAKYKGTKVYNVRPHDLIVDPSVPIWNFQEGEFAGRKFTISLLDLKKGYADGKYINMEQIEKMAATKNSMSIAKRDAGGRTADVPNTTGSDTTSGYSNDIAFNPIFDGIELEINLIPSQWKLGTSDYPEKWVFTVLEDDVIVGMRPCGYYHDRFSMEIVQSELNSHNLVNRSLAEVVEPLEDTMNWLFNSHFFNVRKALNDTLVYDPSRVSRRDLLEPAAGKLIRLLPEAYGTNPAEAVKQLQVVDVTRSNLTDVKIIEQVLQRVVGITDGIMGMSSTTRKTASEVRSNNSFSLARQKTVTEFISIQGFTNLADVFVSNIQQFYDEEMTFRIAGSLSNQGNAFVNVNPETIMGRYDFLPVDGTMPVDKFAMMNSWKELLQVFMKTPQLGQRYDITKIIGHVMELGGIRNLRQFEVQVSQDDLLMDKVRRGDMVSTKDLEGATQNAGEGYGTGKSPTYSGRNEGAVDAVPQPRQVGGMGPVG